MAFKNVMEFSLTCRFSLIFLLYLSLVFSSSHSGIPDGAASLVFVFDTTGSMYDDLIQLRAGASRILSTTLERKVPPLYNYLLIPFHDPDVGPAIVTTDPNKFQEHLDDLFVQGGGDCPEMSLNAITLALEISLPGSFIYVFTDATAKDFDQAQKVLKLIQQKKSQVLFVITGDCGNQTSSFGDLTPYELISTASSGQVFHLKKKDVNQVLTFVEESVKSNRVNLISVDNVEAANNTHIIPVDNALDELTISLSGKDAELDLYYPNGSLFTEENGLQMLLSLEDAKIIAVKSPTPGLWKVTTSSGGSHTLRIAGLSSVYMTTGFGLKPVESQDEALAQPVAGFKNFVLVKVIGLEPPGKPNKVQIIDLQGQTIEEVSFNPHGIDKFAFEWSDFVPPKLGLFYVRVVGVDNANNSFYRASPTALSAILPDPPTVSTPATVDVLNGTTVELLCTVTTGSPAVVFWTRDNKRLGPVLRNTGIVNATHIIPSITTKHQGHYACIASNAGGTSSAVTMLTVKVPREVIIDQVFTNLTVVTGDAIIFTCLPDYDEPFSVRWRKGDNILSTWANNSLFLHILNRNDSGRYECIATSQRRQEVLAVEVVVFVQPSAKIDPPSMIYQERDTIYISCFVNGFPAPSVLWYKEGSLVEFSERVNLEQNALVIGHAELSDAGKYECAAWNIAGHSRATVELIYTVPPSVFIDKEDVTAAPGETVNVHCAANGAPRAQITWYKEGSKVIPNRRVALSSQGHLVISAVETSDQGFYTCLANNIAGQDSRNMTIKVQVPPRVTVDREEVPLIIGKTIELRCSALGLPTPSIVWLKNSKRLQSSDRINITDDGTLVIRNAAPHDMGKYRCEGRSPAGTSSAQVVLWSDGVPPSITRPPSDKTVIFGGNATLMCRAEGIPKPHITWLNNLGITADTDPRTTVLSTGDLLIQNIQLKDAGRYVCVAENNLGKDTAQVILILTGLTPPLITRPDQTTLVSDKNETVVLDCPATGNPQPTITWRKDHQPVTIDGIKYKQEESGALVITSLLPFRDSGTYLCTARNPTGQDFLILTLHVYAAPEIKRPPPDLAVDEGDSILMQCMAVGFPNPRIRWYQNDNPTPLNGSVLKITRVSSRHTGVYRCVAENIAGTAYATAVLAVRAAPEIHEPKTSVSALARSWTELTCNATGYPKPSIRWSRDGVPIDASFPRHLILPTGSLRIFSLALSDSGIYSCEASNPLGNARHSVKLSVRVLPTIIKHPGNISIDEGDTIILECEASGFPIPQIRWVLNDSILLANRSFVEIMSAKKEQHEGHYRCVAKNPAGSVSADAYLTVNERHEPNVAQEGKPKFVLTPLDSEADAGSTFAWDCTATGNPTPVMTWEKDGELLLPGYSNNTSILPNNSLVIRSVKPEDAGQYQCYARNEIGVHVVQAVLRVIVNGNWSKWQEWGRCSKSCGSGFQHRFRTCDNPAPTNGGKPCAGRDVESQLCNVNPCPVHGNWSSWTKWMPCSEVCNGGEQKRYRDCNNPAPRHGGNDCQGDKNDSRPCNMFRCSDGVEVAIGQVHGTVNNVMLPNLFLLANVTKTPTNETQVQYVIGGVPGPIRNWLKSVAIPLITAVYWATAGQQSGGQNGLNITKGHFVSTTQVNFKSGEELLIVHRGKGINEKGVFAVDVDLTGTTPKLPLNATVKFPDFEEVFVQTGEGQVSATTHLVMTVDGKPLPFTLNSTIKYSPEGKQNGSLYNRVQVTAVGVSHDEQLKDALKIDMTSSVEKASSSDRCPQGLEEDTSTQFCLDINECTAVPRICSHFCDNLFSSFRCLCPGGYTLSSDNKTCDDVDECAGGNGSCPSDYECVNTVGSYRCRLRCPRGFFMTHNETCIDVDECEIVLSEESLQPNDPCLHKCENIPGFFRCSCRDGYQIRGNQCEDVDECATGFCDQGCENNNGSFRCFCYQGYRFVSNDKCLDVDECAENSTICGDLQCVNMPGSFQCLGKCDVGFRRTMDDTECADIDECKERTHDCRLNQMCMNTYGSFYCVCPRGYSAKTAQAPCQDVNECEQFQGICEFQCVNTIGSYECRCPAGGILNADQRTCSGVDGCALENLMCEQRCDFSAHGYKCSCARGYRLADNQQDCVDTDECQSNSTNSCHFACVNTLGGYKCKCPVGYHLSANGKKCQDVDECALTNGPCYQNHCYNTIGSYQCLPSSCPQQYHQDAGGFCVNQCSSAGYCGATHAIRQEVLPLPLEVPANTDIARLIPFFPPYMTAFQYYFQFSYTFTVQPSPFGIKLFANEAIIYTKQKLEKAGMYQLRVTADLFYIDGTLACRTVFTVYIDVSRFSF